MSGSVRHYNITFWLSGNGFTGKIIVIAISSKFSNFTLSILADTSLKLYKIGVAESKSGQKLKKVLTLDNT